jgi:cytochrome d ubiquinol oxidase subunit I
MVGIGVLLLSLSILGVYLRWRDHLFTERWFLVALVIVSPLSFIAIISGWIVTEAGRQPWVVYGALRTADAASPLVAADVGVTTILFVIVYTFLLAGFLWFFLRTIIQSSESTSAADLPLPSARGRMQSTPALFRK